MAKDTQQSSSSKIVDTQKNNNLPNPNSRKDESYITVHGWMVNRLKLSGNELLVYALIFSFAKDGVSDFHGSAGYIASALNMSRRTVVSTLKSLSNNGLIKKKTTGRYRNYSVLPAQNLHTSSAEIAQISAQNLHTTCEEIAHHIKDISTGDNKKNNSSSGIQKQTTTTVDIFINACKNADFSLDKEKAAEILNVGIDPSWLSGPFTFPDSIAEYVQDAYQNNPPHKKRKLFLSLLTKEDRKDSFPECRKAKEAEAAAREGRLQQEAVAQEKRRRLDQARTRKPEKCNCGHPLEFNGERGICPVCDSRYFFNEEKERWENSDPTEFESLKAQYLKGRSQSEAEPSKKLAEYFLRIWKQNSDVFNFTAKIRNRQNWEEYWKACTFSESDIDTRMANYISGVKRGDVNRLYIPASPDNFVLSGLLQKSAEPFNKQKHRIKSDYCAKEDISKYFTEDEDEAPGVQSEEIEF